MVIAEAGALKGTRLAVITRSRISMGVLPPSRTRQDIAGTKGGPATHNIDGQTMNRAHRSLHWPQIRGYLTSRRRPESFKF